ncbi:MAG: CRISPR-associated ring nuclease [Caldilineaceae bacterium]
MKHMAGQEPRLQGALRKVLTELQSDYYGDAPVRVTSFALGAEANQVNDIRNAADANAAGQAIRGLLAELKMQGCQLHICVTGGRRMAALLVMSAAALLCDHNDRIWHMYTPHEFQQRARDGAILHAQPEDGVQLIEAPLVPWGAYFPGLRAMAQAPQEAVAAQMGWLRSSEQQCQQVYNRLTERQRDVLRAFAQGQSPQDVAEALHITMATVNSHKTAILDECRIAWSIPETEWLDYHFLRQKFAPFVARMGGVS